MADMFIPDISRGLARLRTEHQNRADMIVAIEAIEAAGGLQNAAKAIEARNAAAIERRDALTEEVATLEAKMVEQRDVLGRADAAIVDIRRDAEAQAATIVADASNRAAAIVASAEDEGNGKIANAAAAAKRITDIAKGSAKQERDELAVVRQQIAEATDELAKVRASIDRANAERRRILDALMRGNPR